jgi:hypothetical protein
VGNFTTIAGYPVPNESENGTSETEVGGVSGKVTGSATLEFYASTGSLLAQPANDTPANPIPLSNAVQEGYFVQLAFPQGTLFNWSTGTYAPFTSFQWVYDATGAGTWVDQYNWPTSINDSQNDNGQGALDGNVTG